MGWWSGNQKYVNRRTKKRFKEAKGLVEETGLMAEEQRDASQAYLDEGYRKQMSSNIMDVMETRNQQRTLEQNAIDRVSTVTGNNPLAAARAGLDFATDDELKETYGFFAGERADTIGAKKAGELQIQNEYLQNMVSKNTNMSNLLMSYQEQPEKGMGGAIMGMAGSIIGGLI